jgi:hypothetical protein
MDSYFATGVVVAGEYLFVEWQWIYITTLWWSKYTLTPSKNYGKLLVKFSGLFHDDALYFGNFITWNFQIIQMWWSVFEICIQVYVSMLSFVLNSSQHPYSRFTSEIKSFACIELFSDDRTCLPYSVFTVPLQLVLIPNLPIPVSVTSTGALPVQRVAMLSLGIK